MELENQYHFTHEGFYAISLHALIESFRVATASTPFPSPLVTSSLIISVRSDYVILYQGSSPGWDWSLLVLSRFSSKPPARFNLLIKPPPDMIYITMSSNH